MARALHAGEEIDAIYNLDEAGLFDEFYYVLGQVGFLALIAEMRLPGIRRVLIPVVQLGSVKE